MNIVDKIIKFVKIAIQWLSSLFNISNKTTEQESEVNVMKIYNVNVSANAEVQAKYANVGVHVCIKNNTSSTAYVSPKSGVVANGEDVLAIGAGESVVLTGVNGVVYILANASGIVTLVFSDYVENFFKLAPTASGGGSGDGIKLQVNYSDITPDAEGKVNLVFSNSRMYFGDGIIEISPTPAYATATGIPVSTAFTYSYIGDVGYISTSPTTVALFEPLEVGDMLEAMIDGDKWLIKVVEAYELSDESSWGANTIQYYSLQWFDPNGNCRINSLGSAVNTYCVDTQSLIVDNIKFNGVYNINRIDTVAYAVNPFYQPFFDSLKGE